MSIITIKEFKGVFTNGDAEDLPPEYMTICQNLRPMNGQLLKTFGFGAITGVEIAPVSLDNIITVTIDSVVHYFVVSVNASTFVITPYYFKKEVSETGYEWIEITPSETLYHRNGLNPIVYQDIILRMLPGNVSLADGTHESKGLWYGRISRTLFDGLYTITDAYYGIPTNIVAPSLSITGTKVSGGLFNADDAGLFGYYRFSYVYDGVQESLLSDNIFQWTYDEDTALKMAFTLSTATLNKRITAIKVYRALMSLSDYEDPLYKHISTINLLREADKYQSDTSGGITAVDRIHVPELLTYSFDSGVNYRMLVNGRSYIVYRVVALTDDYYISGDYSTEFTVGESITLEDCSVSVNNGVKTVTAVDYDSGNTIVSVSESLYDEYPSTGILMRGEMRNIENPGVSGTGYEVFNNQGTHYVDDFWNVEWELWERTGSYLTGGSAGCYTGTKCTLISESMTPGLYANGAFILNNTSYYVVDNSKYMVYTAKPMPTSGNYAWKIFTPSEGLYWVSYASPTASYEFYDTYQPAGAEHPLAGEVSIKVNGKFAKVIGGRLWQADIVLDPGGENEVHKDWISYSEPGQYDVNPVSNVRYCDDRDGSGITGIDEIYGCPVILKEQAIIRINTKASTDPALWYNIESIHNIGNLAPEGYITVAGLLYVVWTDGIYRLSANNLAESDYTPTERLKISNPVEDQYLALTLTQKRALKVGYDSYKSDIIWTESVSGIHFAFNIVTNTWRSFTTALTPAIISKDETGNAMIYDDTTKLLYTPEYAESVILKLKTKTFVLSKIRHEVLRELNITYLSPYDLTVNLYLDGSTSVGWTGTLTASSVATQQQLYPRIRCKKAVVEITEASSHSSNVRIYEIIIEHD